MDAAARDLLTDRSEFERPSGWRDRCRVTGQLWLLNVAAGCAVASGYLDHAPPIRSLRTGVFLYMGMLACAAILSVVPGVMTTLLAIVLRSKRMLAPLAGCLWTTLLLLLYVDTRIYAIFRYHFNGMVWNVLTTQGADEAVHLQAGEAAIVAAAALGVLLLEIAGFRLLDSLDMARRRRGGRPHLLVRPMAAWGIVLVPGVMFVAGHHAYADLVRDRNVMSITRLYPVLPKLKLKRFAQRFLGFNLERRPEAEIATEGILLDYPKQVPVIDPHGPRLNVVILVVDSVRADMLAPETMPRTCTLAARGRTFHDHLSGGNGTRFGLFSLIYGLHGSYWNAFYAEQRSPVLVDALLDLGYEMLVLTSASMSYPEFRSTAWARIEEAVEDRLVGTRPGGRDDAVGARFASWLAQRRDAGRPFFTLVLLDAPHQSYSFPEEEAVFEPYARDIRYLDLADGASREQIELVFNRYRNAVRYADGIVGSIVDSLAEHGELDQSLVLVTGDHGEEFFENGFFGHTSNFARPQIQVPLVLIGPGVPPGEEQRPTSHIDVPATLLELLGADPAQRAEWSLGGSLLDPDPERCRVASGWDSLGVHVPGAILHVPTAAYGGSIEVYDERWRLVEDDGEVLRREGRALGDMARECRRFLR